MNVGRRLARRAVGLLLGVSLIGSGLAGTALADDRMIPRGYDLYETDPLFTQFGLRLLQGFFGPGALEFLQTITFRGVPLMSFMNHDVGDADTVVRRLDAALPNATEPATVPIELVALSLQSVEPIEVAFADGGSEQWDVTVGLSPSAPSDGQMVIRKTTAEGGTFDTQLRVVPLFTFTRLTDGATLELDGVDLEPQILVAESVPWRLGCELPALAVAGLNDSFCPSFDGGKKLTVARALLATHGIRPAQPALEHFECYTIKPTRFDDRTVSLTDQFGTRTAEVTKRARLCNPAQKNNEPYSNDRAHLVCYAAPGPDLHTSVAVRNQFGSQRLLVRNPETLCVPSKKHEIGDPFRGIQTPIDHFQCYKVEPLTPLRRVGLLGTVKLTDQFGSIRTAVGNAVRLCTPVDKDGSTIQHPVSHLVCYAISGPNVDVRVQIKNQFERTKIKALKPTLMCVPSAKVTLS